MKTPVACILSVLLLIALAYQNIKNEQYIDQLHATCLIQTLPLNDYKLKEGTGVLLNSGYILTNKHVIDANSDGVVDELERFVAVELVSTSKRYIGEVIASSNGPWMFIGSQDIAVIKLDEPVYSKVSLLTDEEYIDIGFGEELFAIGNSDGGGPHITYGPKSTGTFGGLDRAGLSIYYGSSGGGIYEKDTGKLVGITTRVRISGYNIVPNWSEYIPAPSILRFLKEKGLENQVIKQDYSKDCFLFTLFIGATFLWWMVNSELKNAVCVKK